MNIVDCKIKQRILIGNKGEIARNTSKSQTKKIKINVVARYVLGISVEKCTHLDGTEKVECIQQ